MPIPQFGPEQTNPSQSNVRRHITAPEYNFLANSGRETEIKYWVYVPLSHVITAAKQLGKSSSSFLQGSLGTQETHGKEREDCLVSFYSQSVH